MKKVYILVSAIVLVTVFAFLLPRTSIAPVKNGDPIVVTPKPNPIAGDVTLGVGQKGQLGNLSLVWNEAPQDSRCPIGAQCVWAGEVKVAVSLADAAASQNVTITMGKDAVLFDGHKVSVVAVSQQGTPLKDFKVTFRIDLVAPSK